MKRFLIVGAGERGIACLKALCEIRSVSVVAVIDPDAEAPGLQVAQRQGVPTALSYEAYLHKEVDVILETIGDQGIFQELERKKQQSTELLSSSIADIIKSITIHKENRILQLDQKSNQLDIIVNSTHDAMIAVNAKGIITLFNRSAERIMNLNREEVIGTYVLDTIPSSRLHKVLVDGLPELNQEQILRNRKRIITNRVPVYDGVNKLIGAVAVFRDITEVMSLAEEIMDLKGIQNFLSAIINSSEDAISVVDSKGNGVLINPAYTRLTGLTQNEIIGKPADVDISEGKACI